MKYSKANRARLLFWARLVLAVGVLLYVLARLPSRAAVRRAAVRAHQVFKCYAEVPYLCTDLRGVVDEAFQSDVMAMRHIIQERMQRHAESQESGAKRSRGIVVAAGGGTYAANAFVNLHVLQRHLNCTLPVAIMYWGASSLDAINGPTRTFLQKHIRGLQLIDASKLPYPGHHRRLFPPGNDDMFNGWKVKMFALYAAPFDEVLLLDGDSAPLQDPAPMFDLPEFRRHGVIAWPDSMCERVRLYRHIRGVSDPWKGQFYGPWEGETGQILFDRRRHQDVLEWLLFLNTHDEFTYFYSYGDKDTVLPAFDLAGKAEQFFQVPQPISLPLYSPKRKFWGTQQMRVLGFLQHHPDMSLAFLHRAGPYGRKYDPAADERKPISHVMLQPSCQWDSKRTPFGPTVGVRSRGLQSHDKCKFDVGNVKEAMAACRVQETPGQGQQKGLLGDRGPQPPVFEVGEHTQLAQVQDHADEAFQILRDAKKRNDALFCDGDGDHQLSTQQT